MRQYLAIALLLLGGCAQVDPKEPGEPAHPEVPAAIVVDGVPAVPADVFAELRRYRNTRTAQLLGWMDGGILIATRFGNTTQLHHVAAPLGMRAQITFFEEPVSAAGVNPGARDGFVYLKDSGGSEFYQLFFFDTRSGQSSRLSDGKSRYIGVSWSPSGRHVGYSTTEGNGVDWDLHIQDLSGERRIVQEGEGVGWTIEDWSADETRLLISRYISVNESRLYEIDLDTGSRRRLLGGVSTALGNVRYGAGDDVYFTADMDAEFMRLHRLDLATNTVAVLTADTPWDVATFAVSRDKARLAYVVNENGLSRLYAFETKDRRFTALPELPAGIIYSLRFDPHDDRLGFTVSSATTPSDAFSVDFASRQLTRWTMSEIGGLRRSRLAQPTPIAYESFDGRSIPAFIYKPSQAGPHPVIVNIHGGPEGQARPGFSPSTQFYLNELGAAVIFPNVRGSAGYGKSYLRLDNGRAREDSVRDIGALLDWIAEQPDLDADRVAVMGGSYGGYMVLASLVHYGDRLRAGVERVGISNFVTFLENTQPYRQDLRRAEYGDERDPDMRAFLESISPLNHVAEIDTPLLISQGLNDPRVPASESEQIVAALKARGVPVWYVLAKNEGHGFSRKANRDYLTGVTAQFLKTRLLANE
ncbi:MAG: S9 family peptidase [Gammaproteobacteria bacterium]|nr:S9 family peptidase [Gammaproteobacteria bacterium]